MTTARTIKLLGGKYAVEVDASGVTRLSRYGEPLGSATNIEAALEIELLDAREALTTAGAQFRAYAEHHQARADAADLADRPTHQAKADRNRALAERCEAVARGDA